MKKDIKKKNNQRDIILGENICLSSVACENKYLNLFLIVICFFGVFGTLFSFVTSFNMDVYKGIIIVSSIILISVFSIIYIQGKHVKIASIIINTIYVAMYFFFANVINYGLVSVCNEVNNKLQEVEGIILMVPSITLESTFIDEKLAMSIGLIFISFIISQMVCYSIIYKNNFILLLLATIPGMEIGLFFAIMPKVLPFVMLIICWIVAFSFSLFKIPSKGNSEFSYNRKKEKYFYVNRKGIENAKIKSGISLSIIIALLFSIVSIVYPREKYLESKDLIKTKREIAENIREFDFKKIFLLSSDKARGGVNGGSLGEISAIEYDNETDLIIKLEKYYGDSIYLRGYIGTEYTGNSWEPISSKVYREYSALLKEMCTEDLNYYIAEKYFELMGSFSETIEIENLRANDDYVYAPYNSKYSKSIFKFNMDGAVSTKETKKKYSINYYPYLSIEADNYILNQLTDEKYLEDEKNYRKFVYDVYTKIPESQLKELKNKYEYYGKNITVDEKIQLAKNIVNKETRYTLNPGKLPKNKDFIENFLFETKEGYCTHYASATTILLRMWGVPARYVEGYMVDNAQMSDDKINVKDSNAHAWVEVYRDGIGWRIVEATPGFCDENLSNDIYKDTINNTENNNKPEGEKEIQEENKEDAPIEEDVIESHSKGSKTKEVSAIEDRAVLKKLLILILSLIGIITILLVRRVYIIDKRQKEFNTKSKNENVVNMYVHFKKILEYLKIDIKGALEERIILENEFNVIIEILNRSEFSNHNISKEEYEKVREFVMNFTNNTYEKLSKKDKIIFKYLKALC